MNKFITACALAGATSTGIVCYFEFKRRVLRKQARAALRAELKKNEA